MRKNTPLGLILDAGLAVGLTLAVGFSTSQGCGHEVSTGNEIGTYCPAGLLCGSKFVELGSLIFSANSCSPPIILAPSDSEIISYRCSS